ncbi:MAG: hypothetical protein EU517_01380 [Promethearchaeota archaeon]|nr:MAG: hypothetical protein EU517_01380 [Candidatus Lokiarchaeota archaeon]
MANSHDNEQEKESLPERKETTITVYQFNDELGDFEELIIDPDVKLPELLDEDFVLLFVDPQHYRVWLWHGLNTTTRMKFIAAKMAAPIRDKHGIAFKITAVDQDMETHGFKVMLGLEEEIDYSKAQTGPAFKETEEDLELLKEISREKILLILEKAGLPEGYQRKMVIVKNKLYGYKEYETNYLNSVYKEPKLFPLKEDVDDGAYLVENLVPRMIISYNNIVLTELLEKVNGKNLKNTIEKKGKSEESSDS